MRERRRTGYGSRRLTRASACAHGMRYVRSLKGLAMSMVRLPQLFVFLCSIPRITIDPSETPAGACIRRQLQLRQWGLPRFRLAQGVLQLPEDYATYLRGRQRQAVRTNISRARERGIDCVRVTVPRWTPVEHGRAPGAPVECWQAINRAGVKVGEAWVTVDRECALLHSLGSSEPNVRWALHSAIVEHLCSTRCRQLLTNSHDAFLMAPGQQYFQRLLGYSVGRLSMRPRRSRAMVRRSRQRRLAGVFTLAAR